MCRDHTWYPAFVPSTAEVAAVFSRQVVSDSLATPCVIARQAPLAMGFPVKNTETGCVSVFFYLTVHILPQLHTHAFIFS